MPAGKEHPDAARDSYAANQQQLPFSVRHFLSSSIGHASRSANAESRIEKRRRIVATSRR
jgi:hypothetical protein